MSSTGICTSFEFKILDQLLRCRICYEYFNVCMVTSCGHNYCSLCIRKYMSYKSQCPICFSVTTEPELRNNRLVDEIVQNFLIVSEKMGTIIEDHESDPVSKNRLESNLIPLETPGKKLKTECKPSVASAQASSSSSPRGSKGSVSKQQMQVTSRDEVPCPICSVFIPVKNVNQHLDDCLTRTEKKPIQSKTAALPERLPKLVYKLLKDKEIRQRLVELGLPSTGTREEIVKRHHSYTILYNANLDSESPLSESQLRKQLLDEEGAQISAIETARISHSYTRNTNPAVIEKEQQKYRTQHKGHFDELIMNAKKKMPSKESGLKLLKIVSQAPVNEVEPAPDQPIQSDMEESSPTKERGKRLVEEEEMEEEMVVDNSKKRCQRQEELSSDPSAEEVEGAEGGNAVCPPTSSISTCGMTLDSFDEESISSFTF